MFNEIDIFELMNEPMTIKTLCSFHSQLLAFIELSEIIGLLGETSITGKRTH